MARPNFSVNLQGSFKRTTAAGSTTQSALAHSVSESASGTSRRKPRGWVDPTSYSFSRTGYFTDRDGFWATEQLSNGTWIPIQETEGNCFASDTGYGPFYGCSFLEAPSVSSAMRDQAITKARLAMKDQSINLGVAFAERTRTADLLSGTANQLVNALRALRKGNWEKAARHLGVNPRKPSGNSITSRWLELQYGWKPLLSDVYGSCEALANLHRSDWRITGKGTSFEDIDVTSPVGSGAMYQRGSVRMVGTKGVFVRIDALPQNDLLKIMSGLGVTNPLEIAWELVPFSFVVDWALPIGNYLSSLDAMLGFGPTKCSISTLVKCESNFACSPGTSYRNARTRDIREGFSRREYVRMNRSVSDSVPLPSLPRLRDPVSLNRMANALSLLSQVFGGRR